MTLKTISLPLALATSLLATAPAQAAGKIYVGAKLAVADADAPAYDYSYLGGVYGGFNLLGKDSQFGQDLKGGTLAVEGEVLTSLIKGDTNSPAGDWKTTSFGLYAAYRHLLTDYFYLKGRAGIVNYDIKPTTAIIDDGATLALGVGAGFTTGPGRLEAEITTYSGDVNLLSIGFHMNF
jgi:hypothetical protein